MTSNWVDSSFEGRKLRSIFKNLYKESTKTEDIDKLVRLGHAMSQIALAKNSLAKTNELQKRLEEVEEKLGLK